ncbi:MAG: DMT family transporter [Pseudotabrizicola sp.]|uniref:DMT family transporter n=1 Tax=Pseudotabrizicola sp. TaxID=2939647 RepID=UPI002726F5A6|nr:DMT family transporter [Pseudotabrizicola sp.]MDO9638617.1 DMT family transporter [Pseudotabrizicola sp.]
MTAPDLPPAPQTPAPYRPVAAALWMLGSVVSFSGMAIAGRQLQGVHDTFEIMAARSFVSFFLVVGVAAAMGRLGDIGTNRLGGHGLRNVVHFTGQNLWFWALTMIPLAQLIAIEFTSPLWVILLSPLLLGERITGPRALAAGLGFVGILIVVRPDFNALNVGVLAAAGAAVCFAATNIATKRLARDVTILSILFWLTVMQFTFGAVLAAWDGQITWPTTATAPWLAVIGVTGLLAHLCLTSALRLAPATFVMPIDFTRLPLMALAGALLYNEQLEALLFAGAALILFANWINIRSETRKTHPR